MEQESKKTNASRLGVMRMLLKAGNAAAEKSGNNNEGRKNVADESKPTTTSPKANEKLMIFLSLRFGEAFRHAAIVKEALEKELKQPVYLCSVPEGESIAADIAENLQKSKLVVIFGTETYGIKTASSFSTYQEMIYILDKKKPFFLIKMCDEFREPLTDFYFNSTISYFMWDANAPMLPMDLVSHIGIRLNSLTQTSPAAAATATAGPAGPASSALAGSLVSQPSFKFTGYVVGQPVFCLFMNQTTEYRGRITCINGDGTYDILYDDNDFENKVTPERIRACPPKYNVDQAVSVNYMNKGSFYDGKIKACNPDGTYDVVYANSLFENKVIESRILEMKPDEVSQYTGPYEVGQQILGNWKNRGRKYPGKISAVNPDGTYNIDYDDGDKEVSVASTLIFPGASFPVGGSETQVFILGDAVFCNWKGLGRDYKGNIAEVNADGTYNINYQDGDKESSVPASRIHRDVFSFAIGDKVVHDTLGKGTITECNSDGTYSIKLDSGELKERIPPSLLKKEVVAKDLSLGQKIVANWKGYGKEYPGKIALVNDDGSYDIDYDDGDKEKNVGADRIRVPE